MGQFNWPVELGSRVENYRALVGLGRKLGDRASEKYAEMPRVGQCVLQLYSKMVGTAEGVLLLVDHGLIEQALALHRVLFEGTVNLNHAAATGLDEAMGRYDDWLTLQYIKGHESKDFYRGTARHNAKHEALLLAKKAEIQARYGEKEVRRMLRHGPFVGDIASRAERIGWKQRYEGTFRTVSRNVHVADFVDLPGVVKGWELQAFEGMLRARCALLVNEGQEFLITPTKLLNLDLETGLSREIKEVETKILGFGKETQP
ncbi:MAG TPA: DUF5677 domain-containing protein [Planctomycetota bacterium]|nr:DUF5677 domain-containing protein [Planctomycetota bacterium]